MRTTRRVRRAGLATVAALDRSGNIVTNAHVAGNAKKFQVQVAGDTAPRTARLVGTYPPDDLAVIRADDPSGLQPAKFGDSGQAQGIGFAIPSNLARDVAAQIIDSGHVTNSHRAALGAEVATVLGADGAPGPGGLGGGVGVVSVTSAGAADRAGLRPGDVIKSVGQAPTPDTTALSQALAAARPGDKVTVTISRDGQDRTVRVTLGELPGS